MKKKLGSIRTDCGTDDYVGQCANCEVDPVPSAETIGCIDDLVKSPGDVIDLFRSKVFALPNSILDRLKALSNARDFGRCEGMIGRVVILHACRWRAAGGQRTDVEGRSIGEVTRTLVSYEDAQ
jgi:hypothetical protein